MGSSRQLRRIRHTSRSSRYRRRIGIDPASSSRLPRLGSRTSALKHVTGHRSAHVGSGYHERCPSHVLPPLEFHFGSTVGSGTRVCRDDLWHRVWHRSQRLDNRSRVAAPIASPWPSTLLSARLSVVPVRQQSSDVTGARPAVARFRGVSVTSPMDEGGVARLVVTRRILHPSPRRCGFEPVRSRLLCNHRTAVYT